VAGAAAHAWTFRPELTPQQLIERILATADPSVGSGEDVRCDVGAPGTNGQFDELDIALFIAESRMPSEIPTSRATT